VLDDRVQPRRAPGRRSQHPLSEALCEDLASRWSLPRGTLPPRQPAAPGTGGSFCGRPPSASGSGAGWSGDQVT
jgi:hypothetical protein